MQYVVTHLQWLRNPAFPLICFQKANSYPFVFLGYLFRTSKKKKFELSHVVFLQTIITAGLISQFLPVFLK